MASQYGTTTGNKYTESYAYTQAGQVVDKKFRVWRQTGTSSPTAFGAELDATYTYDNEGRMLMQGYPLWVTYQYTFDSLGRPTKLTDTNSGSDLVAAVTYGPAGELLSMTGASVGETRTYNSMGQLLTIAGLNGVNLK